MATLTELEVNDSGFIKLPSGTTAQRPVSPQEGYIRHNTDINAVEYYNGSVWLHLSDSTSADSVPQNGLQIYLDNYDALENIGTWANRGICGDPAILEDVEGAQTTPLGGVYYNPEILYGASHNINFRNTVDFSSGQTICIWLKRQAGLYEARRNPYNHAYGGSGTITHEIDGTLNYYFGTNGGNNSPYVGKTTSFTVANNELAFITCSRDQATNNSKWYKNGILSSTSDAGGYAATANTPGPVTIGWGYTDPYVGVIFYVLVYDRQLSDAEVLQIYNQTKRRFL